MVQRYTLFVRWQRTRMLRSFGHKLAHCWLVM
jgi:hypothetical protein